MNFIKVKSIVGQPIYVDLDKILFIEKSNDLSGRHNVHFGMGFMFPLDRVEAERLIGFLGIPNSREWDS